MKIGDLINDYGREHSPYLGNLVNHLPMAQLALYKIIDDVEKVGLFTVAYTNKAKINPVKKEYSKIETMEECLGNRQLYEPCLDIVKMEIQEKGMREVVAHILNTYPLGISSGLFHTIIRVAYAIEGVELEDELIDEVARALAYYITAHREGNLLTRKISGNNIIDEYKKLMEDPHIKELLKSRNTMGQKMKALYQDKTFMEKGFIIGGNEDEKVKALLNLLLPAYINTESIVVLHCITGLHGVLVLKKYYNDFPKVLDILTSFILIHLLTVDELNCKDLDKIQNKKEVLDMSWDEIFEKISKSMDVHVLKLGYTAGQLYKLYEIPELKQGALTRV